MIAVRHAAHSDKGLMHKKNEDRFYAHSERGLYFVTDGMANEVTPHFIVETLPQRIHEEFAVVTDLTGPEPAAKLQALLRDLNNQVRGHRLDLWTGGIVGATLVLALVRSGHALLAHLGDSRIYLHRGGTLALLTRDHSIVQEMVESGELTPTEAVAARGNGGPTRFLGMPGQAVADVPLCPLQAGDRLLLASDGLTEMLLDDDILTILEKAPDPDEACRQLVAAANAAGGHDNITVLVIEAK
jgi:PPM family protein phosphatase